MEPSNHGRLLMVGSGDILQQTPRAVTSKPPSSLTVPLAMALVAVMSDALAVVTEGIPLGVVTLRCSPYAVPLALVA